MSGSGSAAFAAVVLAGGRGSRLGGIDKAAVTLQGSRLVDRAVDAARAAGAAQLIVVGPEHAGGEGVAVVREDPPFTGPLAALAAALPLVRHEWLLLLSCDLVYPDRVCTVILREFASRRILAEETAPELKDQTTATSDGLVLRDTEGHAQWLAGLYRVSALRAAAQRLGANIENAPLRKLLGELDLVWIDVEPETTADIDDREDLSRAQSMTDTSEGDPRD
ncbi:NTP transferase domain-containing protein [Leucobacter insecticola]|uniref:NTP transferase domain-containing protein n=1 Tax=Leucobacter insecticola TaxID=2714934 RepID=A0A6G8FKT1_9MICO|nr:NTP transferase domain-containing protein [Leucobacter insecticola]QIM16975.1 NTP transferase domain-containing protein [Leucobacter insecticola]